MDANTTAHATPDRASAAEPPPAFALVRDPAQARSLLDPLRRAILERLAEPGSASSVGRALDLPRQRINYHVREMEREGLLRHVEDRRQGNCVERILQASARQYLADPGVTGLLPASPGPDSPPDPFSSSELLASAARSLRTVGELRERAADAGRRLPTLSLEARIHFRSPKEEVEFAQAMHEILERMTARYHRPGASEGRTFRVTVGGHPASHDPAGQLEPDPAPPPSAPNPSTPSRGSEGTE